MVVGAGAFWAAKTLEGLLLAMSTPNTGPDANPYRPHSTHDKVCTPLLVIAVRCRTYDRHHVNRGGCCGDQSPISLGFNWLTERTSYFKMPKSVHRLLAVLVVLSFLLRFPVVLATRMNRVLTTPILIRRAITSFQPRPRLRIHHRRSLSPLQIQTHRALLPNPKPHRVLAVPALVTPSSAVCPSIAEALPKLMSALKISFVRRVIKKRGFSPQRQSGSRTLMRERTSGMV